MNRLATRLVFAMMAVAVVSLVAITVSQVAIVTSEFRKLPPEVRSRVRAFRPGRLADSEEVVLRGFNSFRNAQARSLVVGLAAAGALSVALAALLSRTIAKPVERVSRAATLVAAGDLTARVALSPSQERSADQLSELARNFNSMAGSLEGLEGERKAMIADIAHELRTPLTALQLRLEAVLEGLVPFDLAEAERLNRQLELLTRLVEDLRLLSLADAGQLKLLSRTTDLTRLVQEVAEAHRPRASRQGVRISVDAAEALPLQADSDRLTQIITNLLDNALRVRRSESAWRGRGARSDSGRSRTAITPGSRSRMTVPASPRPNCPGCSTGSSRAGTPAARAVSAWPSSRPWSGSMMARSLPRIDPRGARDSR